MAGRILLDDSGRAGGSSQLGVGATGGDGTGDTARTGGQKLKLWAADINTMTLEQYAALRAGKLLTTLTPATMSASHDDYNPSGFSQNVTNRLVLTPASGGTVLNGLLACADGFQITLINDSSTDWLRLPNLASSSSSANRFTCPDAATQEIRPKGGARLEYVASSWRFV